MVLMINQCTKCPPGIEEIVFRDDAYFDMFKETPEQLPLIEHKNGVGYYCRVCLSYLGKSSE